MASLSSPRSARGATDAAQPLAFHQLAGPSAWASALAKVAKDKFKINSVVVVAPNDQGGTDVASVNAAAYKALGVKTTEEYYQRGTTNFAPIVARMPATPPATIMPLPRAMMRFVRLKSMTMSPF